MMSRPIATNVWLRKVLPSVVVLAAGAAFPLLAASGYQLRIGMLVWVYAMIGMSFNLIFGFAGQLTLGQQGFFAVGGYTLAILQSRWGLSLELALLASVAVASLLGLLIGMPVLRLRSHYFAMATLMFGLILEGVALRWFDVTGGSAGIRVPQPHLFGAPMDRMQIYYLVFGIALSAFVVHAMIISSHIGRALQSIRDDETAAEAMGIDVTGYKVKIFIIGAAFSGLAGAATAIVSRHVDPSYSAITINVNLLTLAVVGGLGTYLGPVLGALIVVLAPQFLVQFKEYELLLYGLGLLAFLLFLPSGLAGILETGRGLRLFPRLRSRVQAKAAADGALPALQGRGER